MYYFEYDKEGYLYHYEERYSGTTMMYCFVTGDTVIKYEREENYKILQKYSTSVKIMQRFEAGESWITVVSDYREPETIEVEEEQEEVDDFSDLIERRFPDFYSKSKLSPMEEFEEIYLKNKPTTTPVLKKRIQTENNEVTEYKCEISQSKINHWKKLVNL
jgi:hypothetical protein